MKYSTRLNSPKTLAAFALSAALLSFSITAEAKPIPPLNGGTTLEDHQLVIVDAETTCFLNTAGDVVRIRGFLDYNQVSVHDYPFIDDGFGPGKWRALMRIQCRNEAALLCHHPLLTEGQVVRSVTITSNLFPSTIVQQCN